ncbi:MAG: dual specificity protein phosphatase [Candidatus Aureabacteria bacterium]|nr:dual specificity protein phosphatase [Candidatus Auribacterota bacterium]
MITYILERLAIGAASDVKHAAEELTAMLNVAEEVDLEGERPLYRKIPLKDLSPIPAPAMAEAIAWIREHIQHHSVFVFCNAGVCRSPSVVIGYLCSIGFGYDEAIRFVSARKDELTTIPNLAATIEDCINFYM